MIRRADIMVGDSRNRLRELSPESVQCVVTSPPYWGLRDYGVEGQLGLERTPEEYVANMVAVFREVRRVLRQDGTLWLNLGDSYAGSGKGGNPDEGKQATNRGSQSIGVLYGKVGETARQAAVTNVTRNVVSDVIKPKDLVGIPWRVAFALQADGWWLRSDIVWSKPNPMPESVTDRPTKAHEYLFLLTKSERYFYDADAIREPNSESEQNVARAEAGLISRASPKDLTLRELGGNGFNPASEWPYGLGGRNRRTVWTIATQPFPGAHFAVMPEALVEPCVLAGSRHGDLILDPFAGAGTVGVVALKHGRAFVGVELNPKYAAMARNRICDDAPLFNVASVNDGKAA